MGKVNRRNAVQAEQGLNMRPYLKNNQKQKGWGAWLKVIEHLPSKHEALSSNPTLEKS
jgi:hypothetical protein